MKKVFTRIILRKTLIMGSLLVLSACSSGPRTVSASLALVTPSMEKPDKIMLPLQYWPLLEDENQSMLSHQRYKIMLSPFYVSALGVTCRELIFEDNNKEVSKRIACENYFIDSNDKMDKGWFLENEIIDTHYSVEM
ncbi:hypothetical protein [Psychromonas algicola]|uniref:hypothetical protein n=1 Tax=Psychromonas algicola TaxID=2555642 RepID=UPI001067ADF7|nr:hypothetical protein [Psychromonas sp. RZ5]TEW52315.1 hypothetical protein E2R67_03100 [Psychromonas sp. RZ5]